MKTSSEIFTLLSAERVLPVVSIPDAALALPLANALLAAGVNCAEITFRTAAAADSIRAIKTAHPDMLVGAGTVLDEKQAKAALDAGADFTVSPGFDPALAAWLALSGAAYFPGVSTATEITAALRAGLTYLKFFPAEASGGAAAVKALSAPFSAVRFLPTGGVNADNVASYLRLNSVFCCGMTAMVPRSALEARDFDAVTASAAALRDAARLTGGKNA